MLSTAMFSCPAQVSVGEQTHRRQAKVGRLTFFALFCAMRDLALSMKIEATFTPTKLARSVSAAIELDLSLSSNADISACA